MSKDSTSKPEGDFKFMFPKPVSLELASSLRVLLLPLLNKEARKIEELIQNNPSDNEDSFRSALLQTAIRQCPDDDQESTEEDKSHLQLNTEEIALLNAADWDLIASEFLSKFRVCFSVLADEGTDTARNDEEDNMEYFRRLLCLEVEHDKERAKKLMKELSRQWGPMFAPAEDFRSHLLSDIEPALDSVKNMLGSIPQDSILSHD